MRTDSTKGFVRGTKKQVMSKLARLEAKRKKLIKTSKEEAR